MTANSSLTMNKILLILSILILCQACAIGKKCTYTQEGTKISSWFWYLPDGKPIDLDQNNCN